MGFWNSTLVFSPLSPHEVEVAIRSGIQKPQPWYWVFSARYAGPPAGRLRGTVGDSAFRVWRASFGSIDGPLGVAVKGVILPGASSGTVVRMVPAFDWRYTAGLVLFLIFFLALGVFVPAFACVTLLVFPWLCGAAIEYHNIVAELRELLQ